LKVLLEASTWFEFWKAITESNALEKRQRKSDTGVEQKLVLTYLLVGTVTAFLDRSQQVLNMDKYLTIRDKSFPY
jgi:hypothetical protein